MTKMPAMFLLVACAAVVAQRGVPLRAAEIRHRFLAVDESRGQLLYVDEADASKNWTLKLSVKHRDLQLVGGNRVLLSTPDGYREYDLADRRLVKEVKGYAGGLSARRLQDGRTILACNTQGVRFYEVFFEMARETIFTLACLRVNGEA